MVSNFTPMTPPAQSLVGSTYNPLTGQNEPPESLTANIPTESALPLPEPSFLESLGQGTSDMFGPSGRDLTPEQFKAKTIASWEPAATDEERKADIVSSWGPNMAAPAAVNPVAPPPAIPTTPTAPSGNTQGNGVPPMFDKGSGQPPPPPPPVDELENVQSSDSRQTTSTTINPKYIAQIEEGQRQQMQAAKDVATVMSALSIDRDYQKQMTKNLARASWLDRLTDPTSDEFQKFHQTFSEAAGKINQAQQDLIEFQKNAKVDPDRYLNSQPALSNALNSVAIFFENRANAYGSALGQMPTNMVKGRIDAAITQDIQRQKEEMQGKQAGLTNEVNRYRDNLRMLGDERQAELKTAADAYTVGVAYLNALKESKIGASMDMAKANEFQGKLEEAAGGKMAELTKGVAQRKVDDLFKTNQPKQMSVEDQIRLSSLNFNVGDATLQARDPEAAKKMREAADGVHNVLSKVEAIKQLRDAAPVGRNTGFGDNIAKARSLAGQLQMDLRSAFSLGVMSDGDMEFLKTISPDPAEFSWSTVAKYDALGAAALSGFYSKAKQNTDTRLDEKRLSDVVKSNAKQSATEILNRLNNPEKK